MDLIVRANWDEMEEGRIMCEALKELFADELEIAKKDALEQGYSPDQVKVAEKFHL